MPRVRPSPRPPRRTSRTDTLTCSAAGLPTGLSISTTTGIISGTFSFEANAGSPYSVVVTATDPSAASTTQAFSWTVTNTNRAPTTIGTLANATVREGDVLAIVTAAVFADADGDTLTFSTRAAHEMRRPLSQRRAPGAGTEP
jgi:large repetitive protein